MIQIHKKLWVVKKPDHEDELAYMCQYGEDKEGNVLSNVSKMQSTGRSWARTGSQNVYKKDENNNYVRDGQGRAIIDFVIPSKDGEEFIHENIPTKGFYVGCSVSRWSTSNKLFRVKDPRGFTVEIPTDNLATLLHHTTVINGFVEQECVWGREGNSHILLPVNSEPYLITIDQMDVLENKLISIKDLKVGDWVVFFGHETEYYYIGKTKTTWSITPYRYEGDYYGSSGRKTIYGENVVVKDDKWVDVFLYKNEWNSDKNKWSVEHPSKPKIVKIIKNEKIDIDKDSISMYVPQRVLNKVGGFGRYGWYHYESKIAEMEFK